MPARFAYLDAPTPIAFAHRGGASNPVDGTVPGAENTVEAFERAVALGYRYLETDVRVTADGVPVAFHDATLARVTGEPGPLSARTYAELGTIRVGGAAAIPRLADLLAGWPQLRFNLDLKCDAAVDPALAAISAVGALPRVLLASFSDARQRRVRGLVGPTVATALGPREVARLWATSRLRIPPRPAHPTPSEAMRAHVAAAAQVPRGAGRLRVVDRRFVAAAHARGLQVHVWTVDDPVVMRDLLYAGADGSMTDRPDILKQVLQARGAWR